MFGWFRKTKAGPDPAIEDELDSLLREESGMNPRQPHYLMAHVALRTVCFDRPSLYFGVMVSDEVTDFLKSLLKSVEDQVGGDKADFTAEDLKIHPLRVAHFPTMIVEFPTPQVLTEVFFTAAILMAKDGEKSVDAEVKYYTLELGAGEEGAARTVLGEWTRAGAHSNFGDGPKPELQDFVMALEKQLSTRKA
jgi:hypothetical protein